MGSSRIGVLALALGIVALAVAGIGLFQTSPLRAQVDELQAAAQVAIDRVGAASLAPSLSLDVPNVSRDPSVVPPPILRSQPTTVSITLTVRELNAALANGAPYR